MIRRPPRSTPLYSSAASDVYKRQALVIGSEDKGIRRLTRENCDELVKIDMSQKMDSLNASVSTGILLFEIARQNKIN